MGTPNVGDVRSKATAAQMVDSSAQPLARELKLQDSSQYKMVSDESRVHGTMNMNAKNFSGAKIFPLFGRVGVFGQVQTAPQGLVSRYINELSSPDLRVRENAALQLGVIGSQAAAAVPALIAALNDRGVFPFGLDPRGIICAVSVANALGQIGPAAEAALPALVAAATDRTPTHGSIRHAALYAIVRIGPTASFTALDILKLLKNNPNGPDFEAMRVFRPKAAAAVPALIAALKDPNPVVRAEAFYLLGKIGPGASAAVPDLIVALKDKDDWVRQEAASVLGEIGPQAVAALPDLIAALGDKDNQVRANAAASLGEIGPGASAAVPALIMALKDNDKRIRAGAVLGLGGIGPQAVAAVPDLIVALKDQNDLRKYTIEALGKIGPGASAAVPALCVMLSSQDETIREYAAESLGDIRAAAAVPHLIAALNGKDGILSHRAAWALGNIGLGASAAVPALIAALNKKYDGELRHLAGTALGRIGPSASAAIPALIKATKDPNEIIRKMAADSLAQIRLLSPGKPCHYK